MSGADGGYTLLASLRGLERQLRRLRGAWRDFRDSPSPDSLSDLRHRCRGLADSLDRLAESIDSDGARSRIETSEGSGARPPGRPAPREVVAASRDLDARVWQATRLWKGLLDRDASGSLEDLIGVLRLSADRAAILGAALGTPVSRSNLGPSEIPPVGSSEPAIEAVVLELEGTLWRLQADWHQVRSSPNPGRLGLIRDGFQSAAKAARRLQTLRGRVGEEGFQRSLRVGHRLADGVRFLPWRDPFTGVYNREGFEALAEAELKRCRRYGRGFGLLVLELSAPDLPGLQRAVATARAELREYDLISRYVDDLLLIGVPEGGAGAVRRVASRVLKALRAGGMGPWFRRLAYASLPEDGSTLGGLIREARARLQP